MNYLMLKIGVSGSVQLQQNNAPLGVQPSGVRNVKVVNIPKYVTSNLVCSQYSKTAIYHTETSDSIVDYGLLGEGKKVIVGNRQMNDQYGVVKVNNIGHEMLLRDSFFTFKKVSRGTKNEVYYNEQMNNYLVFTPYDDCDRESICNSISQDAYRYLVNILNANKNIIVKWSQVEGTTSDYTIYYDAAQEVIKKTYNSISKLLEGKRQNGNKFKYNSVKNGKLFPITREEM